MDVGWVLIRFLKPTGMGTFDVVVLDANDQLVDRATVFSDEFYTEECALRLCFPSNKHKQLRFFVINENVETRLETMFPNYTLEWSD